MLHFGTWEASIFLLLGVVVFFILAIINRQANNFGLSFNPVMAYVCGMLPYLIIGWVWKVKYGLVIGIIGGLVGGWIFGNIMGGDDG